MVDCAGKQDGIADVGGLGVGLTTGETANGEGLGLGGTMQVGSGSGGEDLFWVSFPAISTSTGEA